MKRLGPPNGSGPRSERKLRAAGERSHTRSDTWRASHLTSSPSSQINPAAGSARTAPSNSFSQRSALRAEIFGSDRCTAEGISVRGYSPELGLCRALIAAGYNSQRPLHAYRNGNFALVVRSIGEGSRLTVEDDRHGRPRLRRWRKRLVGCGAAAPVRRTEGPEPSGPRRKKKRT